MDFISKFFDSIGLERIYTFLEELLTFYMKPLKFYNSFFRKPTKEEVIQVLVYSVGVVLIGFIFLDKMSVLELIKILISEVAGLFIIIIILFVSNYLVHRLSKQDFKIENVIFFSILTK